MKRLLLSLAALSLAAPAPVSAQAPAASPSPAASASPAKEAAKWDVNNAPGPKTTANLDVTSGTWMTVDVSPDGKEIVFDLLGDIYSLPIGGGEAKSLTSGAMWDMQPRFSPDGKMIAFTSDRAGGDNIWVMDRDGSNQRQVTELPGSSFAPCFTPDGKRILFASNWRNPRGWDFDLYLVNLDGTGIEQVTTSLEFDSFPMFSPDGKQLVWESNRFNDDAHKRDTNVFVADWVE